MADVAGLKTRKVGKVEIVYKSPHAKPNGLQATKEGLWVRIKSRELGVTGEVEKLIHESSDPISARLGVTVDDKNVMWLSSTYNAMHVACSAEIKSGSRNTSRPCGSRLLHARRPACSRLETDSTSRGWTSFSGSRTCHKAGQRCCPASHRDSSPAGYDGPQESGRMVSNTGMASCISRSPPARNSSSCTDDLARACDLADGRESRTWDWMGRRHALGS